MRPSAVSWLTVLAGCGLLGACATGGAPPAAAGAFALAPAVREVAAASAPAPAERPLRAYALTIHTAGTGPAGRIDVVGRQARMPDGTLASVTGSQAAGVFGMSRALGLCGLVALRLDTALADRAWLPGDPARAAELSFVDDAHAHAEDATRMSVGALHVEGTPCAPRPAQSFALELTARTETVATTPPGGGNALVRARYDCLAAPATEPASRLHPSLPGVMLRVECQRTTTAGGASGQLGYAWIASGSVYLLTGHRGRDIAQTYVYTDVVVEP